MIEAILPHPFTILDGLNGWVSGVRPKPSRTVLPVPCSLHSAKQFEAVHFIHFFPLFILDCHVCSGYLLRCSL
jgi:hypothetical protein